ncbi:MAG: hypothetical protein ACTHN5_19165 [Phycisphaerae bacterium]
MVGRNKVTVIDGIVRELGDGADLDRLMESHDVSPIRMVQLMDSTRGKRLLKARQRLGRIHRELLANRFSAFAVQKLLALLQGDKPELWLRAATQVLEFAGGAGKRESRKMPKSERDLRLLEMDKAEGARMLRLMALGLEYEKLRAMQEDAAVETAG